MTSIIVNYYHSKLTMGDPADRIPKDRFKSLSKAIVLKRVKVSRKHTKGSTISARERNHRSLNEKLVSTQRRPSGSTSTRGQCSVGLPYFQYRTESLQSATRHNDEGDDSYFPNYDSGEDEIPSDTLVAIKSLIQSNKGLHIPTTNGDCVQIVLENQIYSIFDDDHASVVNTEILELIRTNKIRRVWCQDMSYIAFILTEDYVKAVWDAFSYLDNPRKNEKFSRETSKEIISWFLSILHHWTTLKISQSRMTSLWESNPINKNDDTSFKDVVHYLLTSQFLIRDPKQNLSDGGLDDLFILWLPKWGMVLKAWNKARRQLLALLAQRKELSKANVLSKNRNSQISTDFLLNDLIQKEKIRIVKRPFGDFVKIVKDV